MKKNKLTGIIIVAMLVVALVCSLVICGALLLCLWNVVEIIGAM